MIDGPIKAQCYSTKLWWSDPKECEWDVDVQGFYLKEIAI